MKRQLLALYKEAVDDLFSSLPADLYPLLVPDFTLDLSAFRCMTYTLRAVSHTVQLNANAALAQVRELAICLCNVLSDGQLGLLKGLRSLKLRYNWCITPKALTQVTSLTRLSLPRIACQEPGGVCLNTMAGLTRLSLRSTLGGQATQLCALTGLTRLNLKNTGIEASECLSVLTRLRLLKLDQTKARKQLCLLLPHLASIDFRGISVRDGSALTSFHSLTCLKLTCVDFIEMHGNMRWFCQFSALTQLHMDYCAGFRANAQLVLPDSLTRLSVINWFSVDNRKQDAMLSGLTNLRRLNLRQGEGFSDEVFQYIPLLERLNITYGGQGITGRGITQLASSLKRLNFNRTSVFTNADLIQMTALTRLDMAQCSILGGDALSALTNLRALACNTMVKDSQLQALTSLTSLHVHGYSALTSRSISCLTNLKHLSIEGKGCQYLAALPSLPRLETLFAPQLLFTEANLARNTNLAYLRCASDENTRASQFDHLVRLQTLSISSCLYHERRVLTTLSPLRDKGIVVQAIP